MMVLLSSIVGSNQAIIEVLKIVGVSVGWIGGLALFMLWKEKQAKRVQS